MDTQMRSIVAKLSNSDLLAKLKALAQREREATASLIVYLAEMDARELHLGEGYSSLFDFCTQALHLSESAAYRRIRAARMVRRFPIILEKLEDGSINLTTVVLLTPVLTSENHQDLLKAARHKSKPEVQKIVAGLWPQPAVPASVRRLPAVSGAATSLQPTSEVRTGEFQVVPSVTLPAPRPAVIVPLTPQQYKVQFTASSETYEKLRRAQDLLRHQIPDGDPAAIFDRALTALLQDLTKQKLAATDKPRVSNQANGSGSRHIQAEVKRAVWLRDGGQCAFIAPNGRRCTERGFLEFHHVKPHAAGGKTTADNIQLRCRAHNGYEARLLFGAKACSNWLQREFQLGHGQRRYNTSKRAPP